MARTLFQSALRLLLFCGLIMLLFVLILGFASQWWYGRDLPDAALPREAIPTEAPLAESAPLPTPVLRAGRAPQEPDSFRLAVARRIQKNSRDEPCGPYLLVTDVADGRAALLCRRLAADLDSTFARRFGLEPRGIPREGVFLFEEREDFRTFAREDDRLRAGYGGYANGARGFLALPWDAADRQAVATTLAHELTHLVLRRALGPGLPPWLAEGLADGIGDAATTEGLQEIRGMVGVEGQARRLRDAYRQGLAASLERLAGLSREDFDRGTVSYDYEQSALFVRYLLASPVAGRFRAFLRQIAEGERYRPELLTEVLNTSWAKLDEGFRKWVQAGG